MEKKKKVLVDIYHDINTEARTQDILAIMSKIGETTFVSFSKNNLYPDIKTLLTGRGKRNYFTFVRDSVKFIKREKPNIVVFHDNYCALVFAILYRWLKKNKVFVIYDSSELYYDKKGITLKEKIATLMQKKENKYIKKADLVIAANKERANIMRDVYELSETPFVIDNIHRLDVVYDESLCKAKYNKCFDSNRFVVFYAGGISHERQTFDLLESIIVAGEDFGLIVAGAALENDVKEFEQVVMSKHVDNRVFNLGFVPRSDLKYLLKRSDVSVSLFEQNCLNNTFCASGKVYESLFEHTPILVSENPPLKKLCEDHKVGISTSDFLYGITELKKHYIFYKNNVEAYIKTIDYDNRLQKYADNLKTIITEKIGNKHENC